MSATGWCFTSYRSYGWANLPDRAVYLVYQLEECPKTKTVHFQGYIEMDSKVRLSSVKKALDDLKCHLEIRRGTSSQAALYCKKDESRIAGPWEYGVCPNDRGQRCDLSEASAIVRERGYYALYDDGWFDSTIAQYRGGLRELHQLRLRKFAFEPRNVEVLCIYGPSDTGKTSLVYNTFGYRNTYRLPKCKDPIPWFQDYDGQDVLFIDEFEKNMINFGFLMELLDKFPVQCPIKGSSVWAGWTKVVLVSNHHPETWYDWNTHCEAALMRRMGYQMLYLPTRGNLVPVSLLSHSGGKGNTIPSHLFDLVCGNAGANASRGEPH